MDRPVDAVIFCLWSFCVILSPGGCVGWSVDTVTQQLSPPVFVTGWHRHDTWWHSRDWIQGDNWSPIAGIAVVQTFPRLLSLTFDLKAFTLYQTILKSVCVIVQYRYTCLSNLKLCVTEQLHWLYETFYLPWIIDQCYSAPTVRGLI